MIGGKMPNFTQAWDFFMITIIREGLIIGKLRTWHANHQNSWWMKFLKKIFHPLVLTISRATIFPLLVIYYLVHDRIIAAQIFWLIGWLTDLLDGPWAVVTDQKTKLGEILDPVCDRFFALSAIIATIWLTGLNSAWQYCLIALMLLDFVLPACYLIRAKKDHPPHLNHDGFGKTKTFLIFLALPLIWLKHDSANWQFWLGGLLWVTILCSLVSIEKQLKLYKKGPNA
jgi:phosphatidylglycerophosphate synthase